MATKKFTTVDQYLAAQPPATRAILEGVRSAIAAAIPKAEEVISYNICAFKHRGCDVIYFAGWKAHFSIYPANRALVKTFEAELEPYEVNHRGTIRFPLEGPPRGLLKKLAKFRFEQVEAQLEQRPPKKKATKKRAKAARR